ncbi:MAG: NADP-dependent oxidoreductase [Verrucomicrobia bacterium]|nr:NADP-dependent oxidoreductase [Verrucomicrobiota bacterium]
MKAVVMNGFGSADVFTLQERPIPLPKEGEVRIRIKAAAFNPVDWKIRENWFGGDPNQILGCDCSGIVDAIGPDVKEFAVGDEVYAMSIIRSSNGSYAEFVCVPVELATAKPRQLTFEEAAAIPLAAMTAYRATLALPVYKTRDSVFVAGAGGGVGSFATQFIRQAGVKEIITIAKDEKSALFLQRNLGFAKDHILIYEGLTIEQMKEKLIAMNKGDLFEATVDLVGQEIKRLCLELTGYSGHFSTILPEDDFVFPIWNENSIPRGRNMSILQVAVGAQLGQADRRYWDIYAYHLELISEMLEKGTLKPPVVEVVGLLSASTVQKAHRLLEQGRVKGKLVMAIG